MFDTYKNYPEKSLSMNFPVKTGEGVVAGMAVKLDSNGQLVKCDGTAGELVMVATKSQTDHWVEDGGKIECLMGNAAFCTDKFISTSLTPGCRVQVDSANPGYFEVYAASDKVGRYLETVTRNSTSMAVIVLGGNI